MIYFAGKGEERFKQSWKVDWGKVEFSEFLNSEQRVRLLSEVKGKKCVVVQGMAWEPDRAWVGAMLLADALKENGAVGVKLVTPFLSYALMNRHFEGEPISARVVAKSLSLVFDEVEAWEIHEEGIAEFFEVPFYNRPILLEMAKALARSDQLSVISDQLVIVSPDKGSYYRALGVSRILAGNPRGLPVVRGIKKRNEVSTEIEELVLDGEIKSKKAVIVDDMVNTGGTVVRVAKLLREMGVEEIGLMVAHWLPVEGNWERVEKVIDWVVASNSVEVPTSSGRDDKSGLKSVPDLSKLKVVRIDEGV